MSIDVYDLESSLMLGDFAMELPELFESEENQVHEISISKIIRRAKDLQIYNDSKITLFMPKNFADDIDDNTFVHFWNMHTCMDHINMPELHTIMQIKTNANLIYAIFVYKNERMIGYSKILNYNEYFGENDKILLHTIDTHLMDLRLVKSCIFTFPIIVLAGQTFQVDVECKSEIFEQDNIENLFTLHHDFNRFSDRSVVGNGKCKCLLNTTTKLNIQIPKVAKKEEMNFWIHVTFDPISIPIISWLRPQNIIVYPNSHYEPNISIGDFNPQRATPNQALWIHGYGFSAHNCRVIIGDKNVVIYACTPTLIKCIVPDLGNQITDAIIQIANRDLFITAHSKLKYIPLYEERKRKQHDS